MTIKHIDVMTQGWLHTSWNAALGDAQNLAERNF